MSSKRERGSSLQAPSPSGIEQRGAHYLFAVSVLSDADSGKVSTGSLRAYLDVSPASATEMVSKLDERGLLVHEKYDGVTLTPRGRGLASELAWRVCVVSTYFNANLDLDLDEQTAFDIAFTLPEPAVSTLREKAGSSCLELCPEGEPATEKCTSC